MRTLRLGFLLLIAVAFFASPSTGRVLLKPTGAKSMPLCTRSISADVTISGQFASTRLNLVFQNESSSQMEAEFIYELPPGAVATYFAYWAGDEKVVARIVEKAEAKKIYETIVNSWHRDPALIEMTGKNTFRARIFPVMPNEDLKVEIRIVQVLPSDGNGLTYSLPIFDKGAIDPLDSIDVKMRVEPDPAIADVTTNYGIQVQHNTKGYTIDLSGQEYRPTKDLNVRIVRKLEKLHASLYAAPLGGGDGFFALAVTPDRSLANAVVTIDGVKTYELSPARFPRTKAFQPITVFGRYVGSGKATVSVTGRAAGGGVTYRAPVVFGSAPKSENLASKLWAAARIQQLSAKKANRRAVVSLSNRFSLPSRYTSWLAVPKDEMHSYKHDRYGKRLEDALKPLENAIAENKPDSVLDPLVQRFKDVCKGIELDPNEELNDSLQYAMVERLADLLAAGKDDTPEARLLSERITNVLGLKIDWSDDIFRNPAESTMRTLAEQLVREQGRPAPNKATIDSLKAKMSHAQKLTGADLDHILRDAQASYQSSRAWQLVDLAVKSIKDGKPNELSEKDTQLMQQENARVMERVSSEASYVASNIVEAESLGKASDAKTAALRLQLDRLCAYSSLRSSDLLTKCYGYEINNVSRELIWARHAAKQDKKAMATLNAQIARLEKLTGQSATPAIKQAESEHAKERADSECWNAADQLFDMLTANGANTSKVKALRERYDAACNKLGLDPRKRLERDFPGRITYLASQLVEAESQAHPDVKEIARLRSGLNRVERYSNISLAQAMKLSKGISLWYSLDPITGQLTAELSRDSLNKFRILRLKARYTQLASLPEVKTPGKWSREFGGIDSYAALLDQAVDLRFQLATVEANAQSARSKSDKAELLRLKSKQDEIKASLDRRVSDMAYAARWGDPLISVNAPADALRVTAIMPDGEIKILEYNADRARWQARFDIPLYATAGEYPITVIVELKDGTLKQITLRYNVDLTPPMGTATAVVIGADSIRLDVAASEDTARVTALMPWGERVEMRSSQTADRFYAIVVVPDAYKGAAVKVQCILTDKAHNRATISVETGPE